MPYNLHKHRIQHINVFMFVLSVNENYIKLFVAQKTILSHFIVLNESFFYKRIIIPSNIVQLLNQVVSLMKRQLLICATTENVK